MKHPLIALLLSVCILVSLPLTALASVPTKNGYIHDSAHLFTDKDLSEITKIAHQDDSDITFYVLTIESLEGKNSREYASNVFKDWNLTTSDILILLSKKERRIEVNLKNEEILSKITLPEEYDDVNNPSETTLDKLIRKHFISYAKNEDYANGLIDFISTFRNQGSAKQELVQGTPTVIDNSKKSENSDNTGSVSEGFKKSLLSMTGLIVVPLGLVVGFRLLLILLPSSPTPRGSRGHVIDQVREINNPTSLEDNLEALLNNHEESDEPNIPATPQEAQSNESSDATPDFRVIRTETDKKTTKSDSSSPPNSETRRVIR